MSTKRQTTGEDYPDAAIKHCDDARRLLSGNRPDGAAYLAGYAVECSLKTLIQIEQGHANKIQSHDLKSLSTNAAQLAAQPTNRTVRYFTTAGITTLRYDDPPSNPPSGWRETLRYFPDGTIPEATARQWVEEAERLYIEIIGELKKDGVI
jgi:HEPN domain-containing protein